MTGYLLFFLGSLAVSFFLGENRQGVIEPYWSIIISCLSLFILIFTKNRTQKTKNREKPYILIVTVVLTLFITSYSSISPAYSLSIWIRFFAAICVFYCLYTFPDRKNLLSFFATGLVYIGTGIACLSLMSRFSQTNSSWLPVMNLIFSRTGHNQAVYILLALFPLVFWWTRKHTTALRITIGYILFPLAITLCFSRGAIVMMNLYLIFLLMSLPKKNRKAGIFVLLLCTILTIGILVTIPFLPTNIKTALNESHFFNNQVVKTTITHEVRLSNWHEAVIGFIHHPLVGSGPGTYILTSMRFHETLIDAAGSAHSFPLQILSEFGLISGIPIFITIFFVCKKLWHIRRKTDTDAWATVGLIDSVFLVFAYSAIEYNLDYFSLWILLWSIVGLLMSQDAAKKDHIPRYLIIPSVIFLIVFATTYMVGVQLQKKPDTYTIGYYFRANDIDKTERFIDYKNSIGQPLTPFEINLISFFHKNQPDVSITMANAEKLFPADERNTLYVRAMDGNRLNSYYAISYMKFLYAENRMDMFADQYARFIDVAYELNTVQPQPSIDFRDPKWIPYYRNPAFITLFDGPASWTEIASKSLYFLGLWTLPTDSVSTRTLWNMARVCSPDWSYFYLELAALQRNIFGHLIPEQIVFNQCQQRPLLQDTCPKDTITFMHLMSPGSHQEEIRRIPLP